MCKGASVGAEGSLVQTQHQALEKNLLLLVFLSFLSQSSWISPYLLFYPSIYLVLFHTPSGVSAIVSFPGGLA